MRGFSAPWDLDLLRIVFMTMFMVNSWNAVYNPSRPVDSWEHRAALDAIFVRVLWRIGQIEKGSTRGDD